MSLDVFGAPAALAQRPRDALLGHPDYLALDLGDRTAFIRRRALAELWRVAVDHAKRRPVEVAFLCMGRRTEDARGPYTVVDQFGLLALGSASSVQVTVVDKERVLRAWPSLDVVGWAHTHPGFGVFFSAFDRITCEDFGPDALNLVVDPIRAELGLAWGAEMMGSFAVRPSGRADRVGLSRWLHRREEVELWPMSMNASLAPTA